MKLKSLACRRPFAATRLSALHDLLLQELPTGGKDFLPDLGIQGFSQGVHGDGKLGVALDGGLADAGIPGSAVLRSLVADHDDL